MSQGLRAALEIIANWTLPPSGKFWDQNPSTPMSYGAAFGSNGERDYMRKIAADALAAAQQVEREQCDCGCNDPVATEPIDMLRFLSARFKYAGVSDAVARHYARDIDAILAALAAAPQGEGALDGYEHNVALREGHRNHDEEAYFNARPQIDGNDRRKVFQAGFDRGWEAFRSLASAPQGEAPQCNRPNEGCAWPVCGNDCRHRASAPQGEAQANAGWSQSYTGDWMLTLTLQGDEQHTTLRWRGPTKDAVIDSIDTTPLPQGEAQAGMTDARLLELLEQHASHLIRYAPDWLPLLRAIVNETITTVPKAGEAPSSRPCTCHPADNPPQPCEQKYALTECRIAKLERELQAANERAEQCDRDLDQALKERDHAQDALQKTHIALGGDGEWCAKLPPEEPPESGDLHYDVPTLAEQLRAQLAAANELLARADALITAPPTSATQQADAERCAINTALLEALQVCLPLLHMNFSSSDKDAAFAKGRAAIDAALQAGSEG